MGGRFDQREAIVRRIGLGYDGRDRAHQVVAVVLAHMIEDRHLIGPEPVPAQLLAQSGGVSGDCLIERLPVCRASEEGPGARGRCYTIVSQQPSSKMLSKSSDRTMRWYLFLFAVRESHYNTTTVMFVELYKLADVLAIVKTQTWDG